MPSGGARVRSGPPPDPTALRRDRRDDRDSWTVLPRDHDLEVPAWPLKPKATQRESALWAEHWAMPQATKWAEQSQEIPVALYVRSLAKVEKNPATSAALLTQLRQMGDALAVSLPGLRAARWVIEGSADHEALQSADPAAGRRSARRRFQVVS